MPQNHYSSGTYNQPADKVLWVFLLRSRTRWCWCHSTIRNQVHHNEPYKGINLNKKDQVFQTNNQPTLQVEIPCGCSLKGEKTYIEPDYTCTSTSNTSAKIRHLYPGAWTKDSTPIITSETLYENISGILNEKWTHHIPTLNMTKSADREPAILELPTAIQVSSHMSFFATAWMGIITIIVGWMFIKVTGAPVNPIFFPVARAEVLGLMDTITLSLSSIQIILLLVCFITVLALFYAVQRSSIFQTGKKVDNNQAIMTVSVKRKDNQDIGKVNSKRAGGKRQRKPKNLVIRITLLDLD